MTRKWNIVNDQSNKTYGAGNETIYNAEVLKSNLCDDNIAYILVRGDIITTALNNTTRVTFKIYSPFTSKYITQINGTTVDDDEDLDLVMPMYNLIEYSSNCSDITCSLWFSSKDEETNFNTNIADNNNQL